MSWNPTVVGLALDILGFVLVFSFGGFTFGQSGLLLENDQSGKTKPLRIFGAILVITGFVFQIYGAAGR